MILVSGYQCIVVVARLNPYLNQYSLTFTFNRLSVSPVSCDAVNSASAVDSTPDISLDSGSSTIEEEAFRFEGFVKLAVDRSRFDRCPPAPV